MIREAIEKLKRGENLGFELTKLIFDGMLNGEFEEGQIEDVLVLLSQKMEDAQEIAGAAVSLREHAETLNLDFDALDTCGTGGDGKGTFNISTAAAIVCSLFMPVAKHGNRAISSKAGSADVLIELGIPVNLKKTEAREYLRKNNFVFLFAPNYHPAMKYVISIRKRIAKRTIFNLIGPLCNPFNVSRQLVGVFSKAFLPKIFDATYELGIKNIAVVSSFDGLDEISTAAPTKCYIRRHGIEEVFVFEPSDLGICGDIEDLSGFDAKTNARLMFEVFRGENKKLAQAIALNSGFALYVAGVADDIEDGYKLALDSIVTRKALEKLYSLRKVS